MIENLLKHPKLWRANQLAVLQGQEQQGISTGFSELDQYLPGQGWPNAALVEVLMASAGVGELRLFTPALQTLSRQQPRWLAWVAPPFIPYAPALLNLGVDINKILVIQPRNHQDALWAVERACKSGACSSIFAWLDEKKLSYKDTQRLQIAAKQGNALTCLFRPTHGFQNSRSNGSQIHTVASMAELRLHIQALAKGELQLSITKRRGGWPVENIKLPLAQVVDGLRPTPAEVAQRLELWRSTQTMQLKRPSTSAALPVLSRQASHPNTLQPLH